MNFKDMIQKLKKEQSESFAMLDSDADKLLAVSELQMEALEILSRNKDWQVYSVAKEAMQEIDRIINLSGKRKHRHKYDQLSCPEGDRMFCKCGKRKPRTHRGGERNP